MTGQKLKTQYLSLCLGSNIYIRPSFKDECNSIPVIEKLLRILAPVAVEAFHTDCRVAHYDDLVSDICQVCPEKCSSAS